MNDNDLYLLAEQYIGDELSDVERSAFEERLLTDQVAREAVAVVVEVSLAARVAFTSDAVMLAEREKIKRPVARRGWWSVGVAACALVGLVLVSKSLEQRKDQFARQRAQEARQAELAILWSEARNNWANFSSEESVSDRDEELRDGEVALPDWMIAAVADKKMEMSEMEPGDNVPE